MWNQAGIWLLLLVTCGNEFVITRCLGIYQSPVDFLLSIFVFLYLCTCNCNLRYTVSTGLPPMTWPSLGLTKTTQGRQIKETLLLFWHTIWSPHLCPLSNEVKTFFHPKMRDTWQWLVARATQLARLPPTVLARGVSRTLLWRELAVGVTTSLYMKAMALAHVSVLITPIQTMSISIWTEG